MQVSYCSNLGVIMRCHPWWRPEWFLSWSLRRPEIWRRRWWTSRTTKVFPLQPPWLTCHSKTRVLQWFLQGVCQGFSQWTLMFFEKWCCNQRLLTVCWGGVQITLIDRNQKREHKVWTTSRETKRFKNPGIMRWRCQTLICESQSAKGSSTNCFSSPMLSFSCFQAVHLMGLTLLVAIWPAYFLAAPTLRTATFHPVISPGQIFQTVIFRAQSLTTASLTALSLPTPNCQTHPFWTWRAHKPALMVPMFLSVWLLELSLTQTFQKRTLCPPHSRIWTSHQPLLFTPPLSVLHFTTAKCTNAYSLKPV